MRKVFAMLTVAAVAGLATAAELKSGPQTGDKVPGPFHPMNVNGESAGKPKCLYCANGDHPVAMVFARTPDCPQTAKLLKKLDAATKANAKAEMGSFAVFLSDDDKVAAKLKEWTDKEKIKDLIVAVDNPSGPAKYKVAKEADLTIVLYVDHLVKANYSFEKGKITDKDIETVLKDVSKILPEKK